MTASASEGATITTIPTPQLKVRSISAASTGPADASHENTGGTGRRPRSIAAEQLFGSTRGTFSVMPPPVMWASAFTAPGRSLKTRFSAST